MSVEEFDRGLEELTEEDIIYSTTCDVVESIMSIYNANGIDYEGVFEKVTEEFKDFDFESYDELFQFLEVQIHNYELLHNKLCDECIKLILEFWLSSKYSYATHCIIDFRYDSEKENFIFYGYYNGEVYKEINLKTICDKLDSKKFLVFPA